MPNKEPEQSVLQQLLTDKPDVDAPNPPMVYAALHGDSSKIINQLLEAGAQSKD